MDQDEVLAAGLADQPWIGPVGREILGHGLPQAVEDRRGAGKVESCKIGPGQDAGTDVAGRSGNEVDDALGQPRLTVQLVEVPVGEHRCRCRLPDHGVAHQCRSRGKVGRDRCEVERCHRVHEAVKRPVVDQIALAGHRPWLFHVQALGKRRVHAVEIGGLAHRVYLGLVHVLRLAQHRGGGQPLPPARRHEVGRLAEHGGPFLKRRP